MVKIDMLAFKMYSSDTESFIEDIISYSKNSIILVYDLEKITVQYKPSYINLKEDILVYFKTKNDKLNYYVSPFLCIIHILRFFKLFLVICSRYRPKVAWIENTYAGMIVGFLRNCHLCDKSIYLPGDWLVNPINKKRLFSYLGNNVLFPSMDYLACKFNDVVLDHTPKITDARYKFWGRKIAKNQKLYVYHPKIKIDNISPDRMNKNICFIGQMRKESGLDLAIKTLNKIRQYQDISIIVIGPKSQEYEYFKKLSKQYNVEQYVNFLGFVETDQFSRILSDCFCGIGIITIKETYSYYTIPGKMMHYIQYLLPVIITEGVGYFSSIVKENDLGVVIEPSETEFINAVFKIYYEQNEYRNNIIKYVNSTPKIDINEFIKI